jgi:hypothetical protein
MKARLQRVGIVAAMGVVTLLGLWVGSRVAPDPGISMLAVFVIVVVVGATAWALLQILGRLQLAYARIAAFEVWFFFFAGSSLRKG